MIKKLLATAVLATLTATAHAQTSIYGLVDGYVGSTTGKSPTQVNAGGMTTSYVGIRSTEDLGNGVKANVVLEQFLRPDTAQQGRFNGDTNWARNAYVSLANKSGEVQVGRVTTPYFISTIVFNALSDSFVFSPMVTQRFGAANFNLAGGGADTGWNNSVLVKTHAGPIALTGVYSAGVQDDAHGSKQTGKSIGGMYFAGPVGLTATWQDVDQGAGKPNMTSMIVGGSVDLKKVKMFAQWNRVENSDAMTKEDKGYSIGATMPMGKANTVMASYSHFDHNFVGGRHAETASWAVGVSHAMSKRTDLYAAVKDTNYTNDGVNRTAAWTDTRVTGVGIRHRF
jgi:predicted porin